MKSILIPSLFIKVLLLLLLIGSSASHSSLEVEEVNHAPAKRSLLSFSDDRDTALVATVDGTINLVYRDSGRIIWSFASGSPIYSSYQAPISRVDDDNESGSGGSYFVDSGDDWKLYAYTDLGKMNLDMSMEDFLRLMPHVAEDGGVIVGSEKTTAFQVDAKTGRLIRGYNSTPNPRNQETRIKKDIPKPEEQLIFTRKDYLLTSYAANSDKVLWNVTVADIGVSLLCQDNPNSITGPLRSQDNDLVSTPGVSFNMPLSCQSKAVVHRLRSSHILDSFNMLGRQTEGKHRVLMLQLPPNDPLQPNHDTSRKAYHEHDFETRTPFSLSREARDSQISHLQEVKKANYKIVGILAKGRVVLPIISVFIVIAFLMYRHHVVMVGKLSKQPDTLNAKSASSRRKKLRKSGKNNGNEDGNSQINCEKNSILNFNHLIECDIEGRSIGKLFVTNKELAKGSNGTIVLEGIYEGRKVAVKRLVKAHHDVAFKEIQNLIASDQHPNIVRWYGVEYDQDFVYLSLELCNCSLYDLIQMYSECFQKLRCTDGQVVKAMTDYKGHSSSMQGVMQDLNLWRANGYPSPTLLKLMRDVVSGLVHLHELGIIHRDLKPHNVLIVKERSLCGKLSDMGISRRLVGDMSSLGHHATGSGSSGWQAPEQLLLGRQTRAVDLFSLGCVLFFCITCGRHPFGDHIERDVNVAKNHVNLFLVEHIPEAVDLFSRLLNPNAALRPKASEVLHHPLLWDSETRLSFLRDTSDRVELEDREADSNILKSLESKAAVALGGKWDEKMEPAFITNIGRYRRYKYNGVRDLLRVVRNKLNHYRELPMEIQELLGSVPEGFDEYFASRFPKLLMEVYKVMYSYCKEEEWFGKYLNIAVL